MNRIILLTSIAASPNQEYVALFRITIRAVVSHSLVGFRPGERQSRTQVRVFLFKKILTRIFDSNTRAVSNRTSNHLLMCSSKFLRYFSGPLEESNVISILN